MENLQYKDDKLCILDQRLLPNEEKWIEIKNKEQAFDAIKDLAVIGAPAIGIFAGYCMALRLASAGTPGRTRTGKPFGTRF